MQTTQTSTPTPTIALMAVLVCCRAVDQAIRVLTGAQLQTQLFPETYAALEPCLMLLEASSFALPMTSVVPVALLFPLHVFDPLTNAS